MGVVVMVQEKNDFSENILCEMIITCILKKVRLVLLSFHRNLLFAPSTVI